MSVETKEKLCERFLREQQESLDELQHVEDPRAAAEELVAELEAPLSRIRGWTQESTRPYSPAA
jgi:hypothetical protein